MRSWSLLFRLCVTLVVLVKIRADFVFRDFNETDGLIVSNIVRMKLKLICRQANV
jgi:hypothetical protein